MNILFLSLADVDSLDDRSIYTDLARELIKKGHSVFYTCATERRNRRKTGIYQSFAKNRLLKVKTLNIQKTNIIEKGIGTLIISRQFVKAIKSFFKDERFDLILYSTPPITLYGVVKYFKKKHGSKTYLMLKDIFPQNAIDLGLLNKSGLKGALYRHFRKQERLFYSISDKIGCMSPANLEYVLAHNPEIPEEKVEVFPNCIEPHFIPLSDQEKEEVRLMYGLPLDKTIFVYGGNLGKPQGIPFLIECLKAETNNQEAFFLVIGDGTEYGELEKYALESRQKNFKLVKRLPTNDFDRVLKSCDVGMVFLDHRFTIPNFPSRILSYLQAELPILACVDSATDIGKVAVNHGFGWNCQSNDVHDFQEQVLISIKECSQKKNRAYKCLTELFSVENECWKILRIV